MQLTAITNKINLNKSPQSNEIGNNEKIMHPNQSAIIIEDIDDS